MIDKNGYIHDKIPSNNRYIYTGILKTHSGYDLYNKVYFYRENLIRNIKEFTIRRKIRGKFEPTSLDEIIGAFLLDLITTDTLDGWHWINQPQTKWYRVLQALIYCAGKDRNFFKRNNVKDLHRVTYWVPYHIQYWILARENKLNLNIKTIICYVLFYLWLVSVFVKRSYINGEKQTGSISQKNIAAAILRDLNHPLFNHVNYMKHLKDYFGENHQLVKMVEKVNE